MAEKYGDVEFINGKATFTLKHNEKKTMTGIPAGMAYTVTESDNEGYTVTVNGIKETKAEGMIVAENTAMVTFNNHKENPPPVVGPETISVSVHKVWEDSGPGNRPSSVTVQLYCDGKAHGDPVTLNESNSWRHTWSELDSEKTWTVDEVNVPTGYTRSVTHKDNMWTVTNTKPVDKIPYTGDSSGTTLWITLACLSAAGLLTAICFKKLPSKRRR